MVSVNILRIVDVKMSISKDIKKKTLKFITDAVGPMVKDSLKQASSYSIDLADLAAVLTQDHKADLASDIDIKGLKAAGLDCVAQLKVLFSVIDSNEQQISNKLTEAFIVSAIQGLYLNIVVHNL